MTQPAIDIRTSNSGHEYDNMLARMVERFRALGDAPLFTTDAENLWEIYLESLPENERQFHNCSACRHFIRRFGGLVTIDEKGKTRPAIWHLDVASGAYVHGVNELHDAVARAKVTGVFLCSEPVWGQPVTGPWTHFHVAPNSAMLYRGKAMTANQAMAEKREDHKNVLRALEEFGSELLAQALSLLNSDVLYRSEKVIGPAQWLADLHTAAKKASRTNVVWKAVATAQAGFCHPRSSMIGTLLEDLLAGKDFAEVSRSFAAKMHPLQYQRPQAAPSAGTIKQAEELVENLGIARSLERRFARLEDIVALWRPAEEPKPAGGIFSHLKPKEQQAPSQLSVPAKAITFAKFHRDVLPVAKSIEVDAPRIGAYVALVTAEHSDAPPILQWDTELQRNPVSWYLYHGGATATHFNIQPGWRKVNAVTLKPSMWHGGFDHQGTGAVFLIDGCRDIDNSNICLFPEILKSELHGVRSVIEAHNRTAKLGCAEQASACGLMMSNNSAVNVRVTDATGTRIEYRIDRWE